MCMDDFWERYNEYLKSDWWKKTRQRCIEQYGKKCFCCRKPMDLQVHHLTYEHLGFEKDNELICLCSNCHKWIEEKKKEFQYLSASDQILFLEKRRKSFHHGESLYISKGYAARLFLDDMIEESKDLSAHGKSNLTNISVIREEFDKWKKENNVICGKIPVMRIQEYFRNRRYEIILKFYEGNYPESLCYNRTLFSKSMIHKVYSDPDIARRLLEKEKEDNNYAET